MAWDRHKNCMGWALNRQIWGHLHGYGYWPHAITAEQFGKDYGFKAVEKKDMVLGKEYIALRVNTEDFHFMKRGKNGHWTHKPGYRPVSTISQKEVFAAEWMCGDLTYGGKIWLFEVS